jgi:hypothetical protein
MTRVLGGRTFADGVTAFPAINWAARLLAATISTAAAMRSVLLLLCVAARASSGSAACVPSVTTASGHKAPGRICSGDLIFDEEFTSFDLRTWNHEKTAAGGEVSIPGTGYMRFATFCVAQITRSIAAKPRLHFQLCAV